MIATASISLSGMNAAQEHLRSHAHNIANLATPGFRRETVRQAEQLPGGTATTLARAPVPGPSLADDVVGQMQAGHAFMASLAVFKSANRMADALLDMRA